MSVSEGLSADVSRSGTQGRDDFVESVDGYRPELLAHCYRMVGSLHEAEDLVQETYVRAWRAWASFEGRSSVRTWLYRIATNVCLTSLQPTHRRILPSGLGAGTLEDTAGAEDILWLDPFPDPVAGKGDPAEVVAARSGLRLALLASLQLLPGRQRAVFILREALRFPADEVAELLDTSVPAVKSALQRARATMEKAGRPSLTGTPTARDLVVLDRYMAAFESSDIPAMVELLRADAVLSVAPSGLHLTGKVACIAHLERHVLTSPDLYRMFPATANGQPAAVTYRRHDPAGVFEPFGIAVLTIEGDQITDLSTFVGPDLVTSFGFPADYSLAPPRPDASAASSSQVSSHRG